MQLPGFFCAAATFAVSQLQPSGEILVRDAHPSERPRWQYRKSPVSDWRILGKSSQ